MAMAKVTFTKEQTLPLPNNKKLIVLRADRPLNDSGHFRGQTVFLCTFIPDDVKADLLANRAAVMVKCARTDRIALMFRSDRGGIKHITSVVDGRDLGWLASRLYDIDADNDPMYR